MEAMSSLATPAAQDWTPVIAIALTALMAFVSVISSARTQRKVLVGTTKNAIRQKWIEVLRDHLAELLALGECHLAEEERHTLSPKANAEDLRRFCHLAKHLRITLGREYEERMRLADLVGQFAASPSRDLEREIEKAAQDVFRERMTRLDREEEGWIVSLGKAIFDRKSRNA